MSTGPKVPLAGAAGGVAQVTPAGISWGDGEGHFVQPPFATKAEAEAAALAAGGVASAPTPTASI